MSGNGFGPEDGDLGGTVVAAQSRDYLDRRADTVRAAVFLVPLSLGRQFAVSALGCAGLWAAGATLPTAPRLGAQVTAGAGAVGYLAVWASFDRAYVSHLLVAARPAA